MKKEHRILVSKKRRFSPGKIYYNQVPDLVGRAPPSKFHGLLKGIGRGALSDTKKREEKVPSTTIKEGGRLKGAAAASTGQLSPSSQEG